MRGAAARGGVSSRWRDRQEAFERRRRFHRRGCRRLLAIRHEHASPLQPASRGRALQPSVGLADHLDREALYGARCDPNPVALTLDLIYPVAQLVDLTLEAMRAPAVAAVAPLIVIDRVNVRAPVLMART
jgi:hypothetical protein